MEKIPIRYINATQKETDASESFNIRDIRDLLAGKNMVQELHRHDYFYILALKKGTGNHEIDFTSYQVRDHSIFIMRPGQVHQLTLKSESRGYLIEFKTDFYHPLNKPSNQLLRKASYQNLCQPDAIGFKKLLVILTYVFKEYSDKQERYQDVIRANLDIFFIELLRHRQNRQRSSNTARTYTQERLEEFLELLEAHIVRFKQVSDYADMLNLSTYQLNAITKETLGKTSSELINEYIILEAKRYLLATTKQVNQIAHQLGYEDVSYFNRFFKKRTGYSPETFRNNL